MRGGVLGGIVSFLGFTVPSVLLLILFAIFLTEFDVGNAGWIHGLKIVAVAVVLHAIIGMAKSLTPDLNRKALALFALIVTLLWPAAFTQVGVIIIAGVIGFLIYKNHDNDEALSTKFPISKRFSTTCLILFF